MILDTTLKSLEFVLASAITTNQLQFTCSYADVTTTDFVPGENDGLSNDTTPVTLAAAPAAATERQIKFISIVNTDTVAAVVTISLNNNGDLRRIYKVALLPDEEAIFDGGWQVYDDQGFPKTSSPTYVTTASNLGVDTDGVFAQRVGSELQFKSLIAGSGMTLTPSGTEILLESSGGAPANPTASIGLTAVNGVLSTYMRSDAAPALDTTIFSGDATISNLGVISIGADKVLTANILNSNVTLAKIQDISTGVTEVLSVSDAKTLLDLSGSNTGDQTITLTGDVTGSGTGSFATTIGNDKVLTTHILNSNVTLAKIANIADQTILGNNTGGAAAPLALSASQVKTVLSLSNVENTALSTWAGTANITTLGTIATGLWNGTKISEAYGGTNQSTYATGDILYASAANTLSKLAAGTNGHVLTLAAGVPTWAAGGGGGGGVSAATVWASVLSFF
jgi:hypothetical protein